MIHMHCKVEIVQPAAEMPDRPPAARGKPWLKLSFEDGTVLEISTNLGEMIGGAAAGARKRWEIEQATRG